MPYRYKAIMQGVTHAGLSLALALCLPWSGVATAQPAFNSGSDGSEGALTITTPGTYQFFDPASMGRQLDPDGDGVYHFTTITIASGVTIDMTRSLHGPVVWLATGAVQINGLIDLNGSNGHPDGNGQSNAVVAMPGAGGFAGGPAARFNTPAQAGGGPGGGQVHSVVTGGGGGAGHVGPGGNGAAGGGVLEGSGRAYGNAFLLPLLGGSGGAGGGHNGGSLYGAGGGAGGGAILIASSDRILVDGTIRTNGGGGHVLFNGGASGGGGGSGGSIRLIAPIVSGGGTLSVNGGSSNGSLPGGAGSPGRLRVEAFQIGLTGPTGSATFATPGVVFLPSSRQPVRIVRIGDVLVPENPTGSLSNADVVLEANTPTTLEIAARGVPPGTVVRITVLFDFTEALTFNSTPLSGTLASSTATAVVTIPHGFSQFLVEANWTP